MSTPNNAGNNTSAKSNNHRYVESTGHAWISLNNGNITITSNATFFSSPTLFSSSTTTQNNASQSATQNSSTTESSNRDSTSTTASFGCATAHQHDIEYATARNARRDSGA